MNLPPIFRHLLLAVALGFASSAAAHPGHYHPGADEIDEFEQQHALIAGLRHPAETWDHALPLLLLGCAAGIAFRRPSGVSLLFAASVAAGALAAGGGLTLPGADLPLPALAALAATSALLARRLSPIPVALLASLAGLWQGNLQAFKVPLPSLALAHETGFMLACTGLFLAGLTLTRLVRRAAGAAVAAVPALAR